MNPSIPASDKVSITPGVINAGGSGLVINGMCLTNSTRIPIGTYLSFANAAAVGSYFGLSSTEAALATVYFNGFDNSNIKPGSLLMTQYNEAAVAAYMRGGNVSALTLAQLQALSGTLDITIDGYAFAAASFSLSAATSFSSAAAEIQTALNTTIPVGATAVTVTYDSVSGAFVVTSGTTGATSSMTFATGTIAISLALTQATGAVLSQGAVAAAPGTFMTALAKVTQNWVTFFTSFNPDVSGNTNKLAFAEWTSEQNARYVYIVQDADITPTESTSATTSLGYLIAQANYSGSCINYCPTDIYLPAFISGAAASVDYSETNGLITFDYKSQMGLTAQVTDATVAANLKANGYNYYGAWATANQQFVFYDPGQISGEYKWVDAFINQVWLNNALQLALLSMLTALKSMPYGNVGANLVKAACADPISQATTFGMFQTGVSLSAAQIAEVNYAAGTKIDSTLVNQGWYLQVLPATAAVRSARASPPITLWYVYRESVQQISLASLEVQ